MSLNSHILETTEVLISNSFPDAIYDERKSHAFRDSSISNLQEQLNESQTDQLSMVGMNPSEALILSSMDIGAVAITIPLRISSSRYSGDESAICLQSSSMISRAMRLITGILTPRILSFPGTSLELNSASVLSAADCSMAL